MTVKVDEKGRLVLPKKYRHRLGLFQGGSLEIVLEKNGILLCPKRRLTAKDLYGVARMNNVRLEDIENAAGYEALS